MVKRKIRFVDAYSYNEDYIATVTMDSYKSWIDVTRGLRHIVDMYHEDSEDENFEYASNIDTFIGYVRDHMHEVDGLIDIRFDNDHISAVIEW